MLAALYAPSTLAAPPAEPTDLPVWLPRASLAAGSDAAEWDANYGVNARAVIGSSVYVRRHVKGDGPPQLFASGHCGRDAFVASPAPRAPVDMVADGDTGLLWTDRAVYVRGAKDKAWKPVRGGGPGFDGVIATDAGRVALLADAVVRSQDGGRSWAAAATLGAGERLVGAGVGEVLVRGPAGLVAIDPAGAREVRLVLGDAKSLVVATGSLIFVQEHVPDSNALASTRVSKDGGRSWVAADVGTWLANTSWSQGRLISAWNGAVSTTRDGVSWTSQPVPGGDDLALIGVCDGALVAWDHGEARVRALSLGALVDPSRPAVGAPLAARDGLVGSWQCRGDEPPQALTVTADAWFIGAKPSGDIADHTWSFDGTFVRWSSARYDCGSDEYDDSPCKKLGASLDRCATVVDRGALGLMLRYGPDCDALTHVMSCTH
ncbi:MAG: hypothetical protein U1F43_34715 [Myxococcota bacterium]